MGVLSQAKAKKRVAPKDFQKDKNRVGKKKKGPANETKTDFKVKRVQMPAQSAVMHEKGEEVTRRNLTLQEVLAHSRHHSPKVRREAFQGLMEICSAHRGVLQGHLARILDSTTEASVDSNADVREAFRDFQSWAIGVLPEGSLAAFAPTLALHVRSALSHVNAEVREHGLLLLDLYASKLGAAQVLSSVESARVIATLCQQRSHAAIALSCLHQILKPLSVTRGCSTGDAAGLSLEQRSVASQFSLQELLQSGLTGGDSKIDLLNQSGARNGNEQPSEVAVESALWEFCLHSWLQAGEMPTSGRMDSRSAAARPGQVRLRCASVLESALECVASGGPRVAGVSPSAAQVGQLHGMVRRGEWPLRVMSDGGLRPLADSVNLRMARVIGLLASHASPTDVYQHHMAGLVRATIGLLDEMSRRQWTNGRATSGPSLAAGGDTNLEIGMLGSDACASYVVQSLDLLWSCTAPARGDKHRAAPFSEDDMRQLVGITARFAAGGGGSGSAEGGEAAVMSTPSLLSMPLTASLLGLRPGSLTTSSPAALRLSWPRALATRGEPCLANVVEQLSKGSTASWVLSWPKALWYLGSSDPGMSAFILTLLLELAKASLEPNSIHQQLFAQVCPMLIPFVTGRNVSEGHHELPPLAFLSYAEGSPQCMAAALLHHFPKISEPLACRLTQTVCRWSNIGLAGASLLGEPVLGIDCCEAILQALFRGARVAVESPRRLMLRIALTLLTAAPLETPPTPMREALAERTALRCADILASWLMKSDVAAWSDDVATAEKGRLSYNDRQRLTLQFLAWPLCAKVIEARSALASRSLCFFFFCTTQLPGGASGTTEDDRAAPADLRWRTFLYSVFATFVVECNAISDCRASGGHGAVGMLTSLFCNPCLVEDGAHSHSLKAHEEPQLVEDSREATKGLAQIFVSACMRAVSASCRPVAYELLAKLSVERLVALSNAATSKVDAMGVCDADGDQGMGDTRGAGGSWVEVSAVAYILSSLISHRNTCSLPTDNWGTNSLEIPRVTGHQDLAPLNAKDVREVVRATVKSAGASSPGFEELSAVLPLM